MNRVGYLQFTQFLRPNGVRRIDYIKRPQEILDKAKVILAQEGMELTMELTMNDIAAFYITNNVLGRDVAMEMCPNGPKVPETVDKLISDYYSKVMKMKANVRG